MTSTSTMFIDCSPNVCRCRPPPDDATTIIILMPPNAHSSSALSHVIHVADAAPLLSRHAFPSPAAVVAAEGAKQHA